MATAITAVATPVQIDINRKCVEKTPLSRALYSYDYVPRCLTNSIPLVMIYNSNLGNDINYGASVPQRKNIKMIFIKGKGYASFRAVGGSRSCCAPTRRTISTQILLCCLFVSSITRSLA